MKIIKILKLWNIVIMYCLNNVFVWIHSIDHRNDSMDYFHMDNMQLLELFVSEMDKNTEILFSFSSLHEKYGTIMNRKFLNYIHQQLTNSLDYGSENWIVYNTLNKL